MPEMLSKSRVLAARQCPKRLWLEVNRPDLRAITPDTQRRFDQGHRLNDLVHHLMPDGRVIRPEVSLGDALAFTKRHLARSPEQPLFEGTFSRHQVLVRADVFERVCPIGGGRPVSCHWPIRRGWCAPKIYVCVCNAVNDRLVREAIDDGKRTVRALREHFGFDTGQ